MIQLGINYKYATGRPFTPLTGAHLNPQLNIYEPEYGTKNSRRYKNYQRLDLRITYLSQLFNFQNLFGYTYSFDYSEAKEVLSYFGRRTIVIGGQISF